MPKDVPKAPNVPPLGQADLQTALGAAIKAQRLKLGVTQEELAWRADLHRTYLADIERGGRNLTLRSITNLARALEVSVEKLLEQSTGGKPAGAKAALGDIMLIEDNPHDVELTLLAFQRASLANPVRVVGTGRAAFDYLLSPPAAGRVSPLPALVLLDLNLPDFSGIEVLREIKSRPETRHIPVVVLTISRHDRNILECSRLGAENYLIKPMAFESLSKITPKLNLQWALVHSPSSRASAMAPVAPNVP